MIWPAVLGLLLASSSCGNSSNTSAISDTGLPTVVATTTIWADVVANMTCGDLVNVESVIPAGSDPHSFEPSLADRSMLDGAQLLVANGLGLEEGLQDTLTASVGESATALVTLGPLMNPIDGDPHVWFDPVRVADVLPVLSDALAEGANVDRERLNQCTSTYRTELQALDAEIEAILATIPESRRKLVTNHDSLTYFADRYGFEVVGSVIPSTSGLGEASPAALDELAGKIRSEGVPAIFTEAQASSDVADALAEQLPGVKVVELNAGSLSEDDSQPRSYVDLMRTTAELIAQALS